MKKLEKSLIVLGLAATAICSISLSISSSSSKEVSAYFTPTTTYQNHDADTYYNSISDSLSGTNLLSALRGLNSTRRQKTMGYKTGGTTATDSDFIYTDYDTSDPSTLHTDKNGQTYGTVISSFYSYSPCTSFNKEHVWPNTHGGNKVESDVHMARPTIQAENSSRGHSYYVDGMVSKNNTGWDPYAAFKSTYGEQCKDSRGESARIIFYCMVASDQLVLEAGHSDSSDTSNNKMGDLVDILKWNVENSVTEREKNRNEGAEYLQGNRNPFIDHPEYACKIWGNTNDATKKICGSQPTPTKTLTDLTYTGTPTKKDYVFGESFNPSGLTVTAKFSDNTSQTVTNNVTWSTLVEGQTSVTGSYTYEGTTKQIVISGITVSKPAEKTLSSLTKTGTLTKKDYVVGESFNPSGLTITANFSDGSSSVVTSQIVWPALSLNQTSIIGTYTYGGVTKSILIDGITVTQPVETKTLIALDSSGVPEKTTYNVGESFDSTGLIITATYDDDSSEDVTALVTWSTLKAGDTAVTGTYEYMGVEKSVTIDGITVNGSEPPVSDRKQVGIVVSKNPNKLVYNVGDTFEQEGIKVISIFDDGTNEDITKDAVIIFPDLTSTGNKLGRVTYNGFETTFSVVVLEAVVTNIYLMNLPAKTEYFADEEFNPYGAVVKATLNNGSAYDNVIDQCTFSYDFNASSLVTIEFAEKQIGFVVTLLEGTPTVEHKAADFAYSFNETMEDINPEQVSVEEWNSMEYYYNQLDEEAKNYVKELDLYSAEGSVNAAVSNEEALKECVKKYDETYLAHKDEGFEDYIGRNPKAHDDPQPKQKDNSSLLIFIGVVGGILLVAIIIISIAVPVSKKHKKARA